MCVEIPGITRCRPDVFATSALLKVNALPYLLHLDLAHDVDDSETVAATTECGITFTLLKVEALCWLNNHLQCSAALHPWSFPTGRAGAVGGPYGRRAQARSC